MTRYHQRLPSTGPAREALRKKGHFWTPTWVSEAMVAYVLTPGCTSVFDPAVGPGTFLLAAKARAGDLVQPLTLLGTEKYPDVLSEAYTQGLSAADLAQVEITDFVFQPPTGPFPAIVANPPYLRHHRLSSAEKSALKIFCQEFIGTALDARAGLHVYFLLRALQLLAVQGRLAFILPADTFEGKFAPTLWTWITTHYRVDGVVTFTADASPFPGVDTNALIILLSNAAPQTEFPWVQCTEAWTDQLKLWVQSGLSLDFASNALDIRQRNMAEALTTGFSRPPLAETFTGLHLSDFAQVMRGIATGANEFFFLTPAQVEEHAIPPEFLRSAIGRIRDVVGNEITEATLETLRAKKRPTLLFTPDGRPLDQFPEAVQRYLLQGQALGLPELALISQRKPWYKMEQRKVPPFLFAYLGRRNARFIRNVAGVLPLTGFLCVYPRQEDPAFLEKLWQVLNHPQTIANLVLVGKSYGAGAIKVEPRGLENLPLPIEVVAAAQLEIISAPAKSGDSPPLQSSFAQSTAEDLIQPNSKYARRPRKSRPVIQDTPQQEVFTFIPV